MDKRGSKGGHVCASYYCKNNKRNSSQISFFTFPRDSLRSRQWAIACGRKDLLAKTPLNLSRSYRLCSVHFADDMYGNGNRLKPNAIPTIFRNRNVTTGLPSLEKNKAVIQMKEHNYCSNILSLPTSEIENFFQKSNVITAEPTSSSPFIIRAKVFHLPSAYNLQRFVQRIKLKPGKNEIIFKALRMKTDNFVPQDKMVILCVDKMNIKANVYYNLSTGNIIGFEDLGPNRVFTPAHTATVLLVKGLYHNWEQNIAYYFVNSTCPGIQLKYIINDMVSALQEIGLKVCGVVCDLGANSVQLSRLLGVSEQHPYFTINDQNIVFIFDVPHLLKSTRNNLLKYTFQFNNKTITWNDIRMFYNHDKNCAIRAAPKLTESHISPTCSEKMKVKYASQVFSNTVATGMTVYLRFDQLPARAIGTIEFITLMDKLFDLLNSSTTCGRKQYKCAYKDLSYQVDFLHECVAFFKSVQVFDHAQNVTNKIRCLKAWRISINGFIYLWDILKTSGFDCLYTERVNQDALENMFESIRQQCKNAKNPTPLQFYKAYKQVFCLQLLHSGTANCENDGGNFLSKVLDLVLVKDKTPLQRNVVCVTDIDFRTSDILQQNFARYFCAYLLNNCLKRHSCIICENFARVHQNLDDSALFCYLKAYENAFGDTFGNLKMPDDNFVYYIANLETLFQKHFESIVIKDNVISEFVKLWNTVIFKHPCALFPYDYLKHLYCRVRLFYMLKNINRNFKSVNLNRKLIIWRNR